MSDEALAVARVPKGCPATEPEQAQWVRRYLESGLSLRRFSAQNGLGYMSLWRWVNKAGGQAKPAGSAGAEAFTEIKLLPSAERLDWVAELSLPDGRRLRLAREVPAALLEQLLRVC